MDGKPGDNTLATHILHLPPRRAANIIKRLTETVFAEVNQLNVWFGWWETWVGRVWRFRGNGLKLFAERRKDLGQGQGEAFPRAGLQQQENCACAGGQTLPFVTTDPGQEPGLSFLSGTTCVRVTSEEHMISGDYHRVTSKVFSSLVKLRHCPPKMLWRFSNLVSIRITRSAHCQVIHLSG